MSLYDTVQTLTYEDSISLLAKKIDSLTSPIQIIIDRFDSDVKMPTKANESDVCFDVYAHGEPVITQKYVEYRTGFRMQIPEGYSVDLFTRSSVSNTDLILANGIGVVDCIPKNANILTSLDGSESSLEDILSGKINQVVSYNLSDKKLELQNIEDVFSVGEKNVYLIELEDGRSIKVTEEELIYSEGLWKKCKDLKVGDVVSSL